MAIKVHTRIPFGNARVLGIHETDGVPEAVIAAEPHGGPEALWFCCRFVPEDDVENPTGKLRVTLAFVNNMLGCGELEHLRPAYHPVEQPNWHRANAGQVAVHPDGRRDVTWEIPFTSNPVVFAVFYPYGHKELDVLVRKSKGYWASDHIGLTQEGRLIRRLSNTPGALGSTSSGVYLVARQHAGETPGSWVLDGILERFAKSKRTDIVIWCVPLADEDGVANGHYGKDRFPYDLNRAWGNPPMRHETLVVQRDMREWAKRCSPLLVVDLHAPGATEADGVYAFIPAPENDGAKEAQSMANVLKQGIGPDYAAENFARVARYPSRWDTPNLTTFAGSAFSVCALSIETPYALCGKTVMTQKIYRDVGNRIANAIIHRTH